ncbi:phosphotransferase [Frigidibacter albus]|uniref:Phosphotransferase n=1 Tax=Frigidibacter albus TaxID=1465486 RepID=A0A6L8VKD7_9RHOB|nr:phosphotransferase [Frigidibacter albus]MZQ90251.1 phosphotransferase [Frigidibacter albus]NBE32251.1 phosphotransferase [Frigidibacter albus]GGH58360.1 homoserine kinase [Frigidibacter albus]
MTDAEALELAGRALALWGGGGAPRLVKNRENIVFEVRLAQGPRAALRLHRPGYQTVAGIESELCWMQGLAAAGLRVPAPLPALSGALVEALDGRCVSCVGWLEGEPLGSAEAPLPGSAADQAARMHDLGALIARLHDGTDAMMLPPGFARPSWDEDGFLGEAALWGRFWESPAFAPGERALMLEARDVARQMLAEVRAEGCDFGLIHADVLRENVLCHDGQLALIDFDDSGFGFRHYDLATALVQSLEEPALPDLAATLVAGYRETRTLAPGRLALFVMLRCCASAGWIASRAGPDDPRQRFYAGRALRMARHVLDGTAPWELGL